MKRIADFLKVSIVVVSNMSSSLQNIKQGEEDDAGKTTDNSSNSEGPQDPAKTSQSAMLEESTQARAAYRSRKTRRQLRTEAVEELTRQRNIDEMSRHSRSVSVDGDSVDGDEEPGFEISIVLPGDTPSELRKRSNSRERGDRSRHRSSSRDVIRQVRERSVHRTRSGDVLGSSRHSTDSLSKSAHGPSRTPSRDLRRHVRGTKDGDSLGPSGRTTEGLSRSHHGGSRSSSRDGRRPNRDRSVQRSAKDLVEDDGPGTSRQSTDGISKSGHSTDGKPLRRKPRDGTPFKKESLTTSSHSHSHSRSGRSMRTTLPSQQGDLEVSKQPKKPESVRTRSRSHDRFDLEPEDESKEPQKPSSMRNRSRSHDRFDTDSDEEKKRRRHRSKSRDLRPDSAKVASKVRRSRSRDVREKSSKASSRSQSMHPAGSKDASSQKDRTSRSASQAPRRSRRAKSVSRSSKDVRVGQSKEIETGSGKLGDPKENPTGAQETEQGGSRVVEETDATISDKKKALRERLKARRNEGLQAKPKKDQLESEQSRSKERGRVGRTAGKDHVSGRDPSSEKTLISSQEPSKNRRSLSAGPRKKLDDEHSATNHLRSKDSQPHEPSKTVGLEHTTPTSVGASGRFDSVLKMPQRHESDSEDEKEELVEDEKEELVAKSATSAIEDTKKVLNEDATSQYKPDPPGSMERQASVKTKGLSSLPTPASKKEKVIIEEMQIRPQPQVVFHSEENSDTEKEKQTAEVIIDVKPAAALLNHLGLGDEVGGKTATSTKNDPYLDLLKSCIASPGGVKPVQESGQNTDSSDNNALGTEISEGSQIELNALETRKSEVPGISCVQFNPDVSGGIEGFVASGNAGETSGAEVNSKTSARAEEVAKENLTTASNSNMKPSSSSKMRDETKQMERRARRMARRNKKEITNKSNGAGSALGAHMAQESSNKPQNLDPPSLAGDEALARRRAARKARAASRNTGRDRGVNRSKSDDGMSVVSSSSTSKGRQRKPQINRAKSDDLHELVPGNGPVSILRNGRDSSTKNVSSIPDKERGENGGGHVYEIEMPLNDLADHELALETVTSRDSSAKSVSFDDDDQPRKISRQEARKAQKFNMLDDNDSDEDIDLIIDAQKPKSSMSVDSNASEGQKKRGALRGVLSRAQSAVNVIEKTTKRVVKKASSTRNLFS